eukprot:3258039-Amphidinium_carterae.1
MDFAKGLCLNIDKGSLLIFHLRVLFDLLISDLVLLEGLLLTSGFMSKHNFSEGLKMTGKPPNSTCHKDVVVGNHH